MRTYYWLSWSTFIIIYIQCTVPHRILSLRRQVTLTRHLCQRPILCLCRLPKWPPCHPLHPRHLFISQGISLCLFLKHRLLPNNPLLVLLRPFCLCRNILFYSNDAPLKLYYRLPANGGMNADIASSGSESNTAATAKQLAAQSGFLTSGEVISIVTTNAAG